MKKLLLIAGVTSMITACNNKPKALRIAEDSTGFYMPTALTISSNPINGLSFFKSSGDVYFMVQYDSGYSRRKNGRWEIQDTMKTIEEMYQSCLRLMKDAQRPVVIISANHDTARYYYRDTIRLGWEENIRFSN